MYMEDTSFTNQPSPADRRTVVLAVVLVVVFIVLGFILYRVVRPPIAVAPTPSKTQAPYQPPLLFPDGFKYASSLYSIKLNYPKEFALDDRAENQIELRKINQTTKETTELLVITPNADEKYFFPKTTPKDYEPAVKRSVSIETTTYEGIFYKPSATAPKGRGLLLFVFVPRQDDFSTGIFLAADDQAGIDLMLKILQTMVL